MTFEIHHGGNSLNNVANLHIMCGIPNSEFFEVILPDDVQKYGLVDDLVVDRKGMVRVPDCARPRRRDRFRKDPYDYHSRSPVSGRGQVATSLGT